MKKSLYFALLGAVVVLSAVGCGSHKSQASYEAPTTVMSANYDGSYVLRVEVRSRNAAIAFTDAQRKAVKEVLFDGVKAGNNGISDLKPIIFDKNAQAKYETYFNTFFQDKGEWTKYASLHDKRTATTTYARDGKQMIEVVTVTVMRNELKQKMQEDGIVPKENMYQL